MFEPLAPEIAFSHFIQSFSTVSLDQAFHAITLLGHPGIWIFLVAFLYWKGDEKKSFFLATVLLFTAATVGILKNLVMRLRPSAEEFRVLVYESDSIFGFPSGHATTIGGIFGYYFEKFKKKARLLGLVIVILVMVSRIYLGVHFLGDVVVGVLFGFLIGRLIHYFEKRFEKVKLNHEKMMEETGIIAAVLISIVISLAFRPLGLAAGFMGYFAGVFAFKLLKHDSRKLEGKQLWIKEKGGFAVLGTLGIAAEISPFAPEIYFISGAWISLIYPSVYERVLKQSKLK